MQITQTGVINVDETASARDKIVGALGPRQRLGLAWPMPRYIFKPRNWSLPDSEDP